MANVKLERLNHLIQQEISIILMEEVRDEDLKFVTITGCDTTFDPFAFQVILHLLVDSKIQRIPKFFSNMLKRYKIYLE